MTNNQETKFYVYVYLDPRKPGKYVYGEYEFEYEPFYVGKGYGGRCMRHVQDYILETDTNKMKTNKIKKIIRETGDIPIIIKYIEHINESHSFYLETDMIKNIGRKDLKLGPLTNLTDGGEGDSGRVMTEEQKQKIRVAHLGLHPDEKTIKKMSESQKKRWENLDDEYKKQWSEDIKNRYTPEKRKLLSEQMQGDGNPNFNNKWDDNQKEIASKRQKKKGNWSGDKNPSRINPPRGKKSSFSMYKYTLLDKQGNILMESYSIKDIAEKFNISYLGLKYRGENGGLYLDTYRLNRKKYK